MNLTYLEKKHWWIEQNATVPCAVTKDGAVVMFMLSDVEALLNQTYPHDNKVWWFNESKDREIAERSGDRVIANPQVLWRHYLPLIPAQAEPPENSGNVLRGNEDRASISGPPELRSDNKQKEQ